MMSRYGVAPDADYSLDTARASRRRRRQFRGPEYRALAEIVAEARREGRRVIFLDRATGIIRIGP